MVLFGLSPLFWVLVALIASIVGVTILFAVRRRRVWERFARRHGLRYTATPPSVEGEVEGRAVRLYVSSRSSDTGVLAIEEIRLSVELRGLPEGLVVREAQGVAAAARAAEDHGLLLGDEDFDTSMVVACPHPAAAKEYLTAPRREALLTALESVRPATLTLAKHRIYLGDREASTRLARLEARFRILLALARGLDDE